MEQDVQSSCPGTARYQHPASHPLRFRPESHTWGLILVFIASWGHLAVLSVQHWPSCRQGALQGPQRDILAKPSWMAGAEPNSAQRIHTSNLVQPWRDQQPTLGPAVDGKGLSQASKLSANSGHLSPVTEGSLPISHI
jgi:hypothetical protein